MRVAAAELLCFMRFREGKVPHTGRVVAEREVPFKAFHFGRLKGIWD